VDEAIQATQRVIDQTRRVKEGLLQDLLTRGMPGHTRFKQTEIGEIPESWEVTALNALCRPKQWPTIKVSDLDGGQFPVYGANGLIGSHSTYTHAERTVAMTCRGATCGTISIIPAFSYLTGNAMALDEVKTKRIGVDFLAASLTGRGLADIIEGSAQPQITRTGLQHVYLAVPPLPEQGAISEVLLAINKSDESNVTRVMQLKTTKTGLLQDLLTGKVRVSP